MARPTPADAGLLACAVLLLFAGQSSATLFDFPSFPFIAIFPSIFPPGYVQPPPVRIYSRQDTRLNMAARDDGRVVLVTATYGDLKQIPAPTNVGYGYWLVNVATWKVMTPPAYGLPVQLADFNPLFNGKQSLWVPTRPLYGDFYQIKSYTQYSKALNGLGGSAYPGTTVIGIYPDTPASPNTLWVTTSDFPCRSSLP